VKWYKWRGTSRWNHWGRRYALEDRQRWEPRWSERRWPITDGEYLPESRAAGQVFEGVPQGDGVERRTRMHIGDIRIDRESCLASRGSIRTSLRYERPARMFRRRSQYPASGQRRPRQLAGGFGGGGERSRTRSEQYAYRQDRSALDAVKHVHKLINTGHGEIVDADLSSYFDTLPHSELLKSVARRVVDGAMLHLIKMWLEAPVEETDERGNKHRSTRNRDEGRGSPQGSPISPLLSNLYMRRFVLGWKKLGHEKRLQAYIVNYADDLVICCRGKAEEALGTMRNMMTKLKLTVNEKKTRVCKLPEEKFDFLGYTFGRCYSPKTGRAYLGTTPSKKRVQRICAAISEETRRSKTQLDRKTVVGTLNRMMIGWANYFCLGPVSKAYSAVERHARKRLRQWLRAKHNLRGSATKQHSAASLHDKLGLARLTRRTSSFPWATS